MVKHSGPVTNKGFNTLLYNGSQKWYLKMESEIGALIKLTIVNKRDKLLLLQIQCQKGILVRMVWASPRTTRTRARQRS